jgi:hypothetical protein
MMVSLEKLQATMQEAERESRAAPSTFPCIPQREADEES